MKSLQAYIKEELDNNLFWLLDTWFTNNESQLKEFVELIAKCSQQGRSVNIDFLRKEIKDTLLEQNIKEFINFVDGTVEDTDKNKDYIYVLKQIIELVINNYSKNNKYINYEKR